MQFDTRDEAIEFCAKHNLEHQVIEPKARRVTRKSYAENFSYTRDKNWTH